MSPAHRAPAGPIDERGFHAWLARTLPSGRSGLLPLGDDAAALAPPAGSVAVVTTDALIEGTHFRRDSPPAAVGRATTGVSLSDLAAKGAAPAAILIALVVPPSTPLGWAQAVVAGAEAAGARFGAHVVGGDTKGGPVRTVVGFALGWAARDRLAPRSGARPGDLVVTTGTVGRGGAAYDRFRRRPGAAALTAMADVRPRVREGRALGRWAHAMLDTSDGLAESCRLLADASAVRVAIDAERLPLDPTLPAGRPPAARLRLAFYGGDYELLAAVPARAVAAARRAVRRVGGRLTTIGSVAPGRGAVLRVAGRPRPMPPPGWDPFASVRRPRR